MDSESLAGGIGAVLLMFFFGVIETDFTSSAIVVLAFVLTGLAVVSWIFIVRREYGISRSGAKSIS